MSVPLGLGKFSEARHLLRMHPAGRDESHRRALESWAGGLRSGARTRLSRTAQNMQLAIVCQRLPGFQLADLHQIEAQLIA